MCGLCRLCRLRVLIVPLAVLFVSPPALAQERSPETQRLDYYVGQWDFDAGDFGSGTMDCDWLGSRVLRCDSEITMASGTTHHLVGVWRYNASAERYNWVRYWGNGLIDDHIGWVQGDTWTWVQRDSAGGRYRFTMVEESPDRMTMRSEQSFDGRDWEYQLDAVMSRVR